MLKLAPVVEKVVSNYSELNHSVGPYNVVLAGLYVERFPTGECEVLPKKLRQNLCKPCYESVSEIVRLEPLSGLEP